MFYTPISGPMCNCGASRPISHICQSLLELEKIHHFACIRNEIAPCLELEIIAKIRGKRSHSSVFFWPISRAQIYKCQQTAVKHRGDRNFSKILHKI